MKLRSMAWLLLMPFIGCQAVEAPGPAPESESQAASEAAPGFENPDLLVDTDWLADHLGDDGLRILDARDEESYAAGHIPGAIRVDRSDLYDPDRDPGSMVGTPEQIATRFGEKGVDEYVHVVVYDQGRATTAARVFWTLEYYGHPRVSVLNGGITKWEAEGRELSTDTPSPTPVTFTVRANPEAVSTQDQVADDLADENVVILDVRSDEEFSGEVARADRGGHIPGAVHIEWTHNFTDGDVPVFKPSFQLAQLYEDQGVTPDKRIHAY